MLGSSAVAIMADPTMVANMRYQQHKGVVVTDLGDEIVLLDTNNQKMFSLNSVGRFIWNECIGHDLSFVIGRIVSIYKVEPKVASHDVDNIIEELLKNNLIVQVNVSKNHSI